MINIHFMILCKYITFFNLKSATVQDQAAFNCNLLLVCHVASISLMICYFFAFQTMKNREYAQRQRGFLYAAKNARR
jgi:hypothetical protein